MVWQEYQKFNFIAHLFRHTYLRKTSDKGIAFFRSTQFAFCLMLLWGLLFAVPIAAKQPQAPVSLLALFKDKALLQVAGQPTMMKTGETDNRGIRLVSADSKHAIIEVNGHQQVLFLGSGVKFPGLTEAEPRAVSIWANSKGIFFASGKINAFPVNFVVDTGAATVAISSETAKRIGIEYLGGEKSRAHTAGGVVPVYNITLKKINVRGISVSNVVATVVEGSHPKEPLLGMSFLRQVKITSEGNRLDIKPII